MKTARHFAAKLYTPCLKNCAKLFFCQSFHQISTNFDDFWQKDDKEAKIMRGALIFHLASFASPHYRVKRRCSKFLHNYSNSIRLLKFASSIRQSAPRHLITLWD